MAKTSSKAADDSPTHEANNEDSEIINVSEQELDGTRVIIQETKDEKMTMVFCGDQKNIALSMLENIRKKLEKSKKEQVCVFKVKRK